MEDKNECSERLTFRSNDKANDSFNELDMLSEDEY